MALFALLFRIHGFKLKGYDGLNRRGSGAPRGNSRAGVERGGDFCLCALRRVDWLQVKRDDRFGGRWWRSLKRMPTRVMCLTKGIRCSGGRRQGPNVHDALWCLVRRRRGDGTPGLLPRSLFPYRLRARDREHVWRAQRCLEL